MDMTTLESDDAAHRPRSDDRLLLIEADPVWSELLGRWLTDCGYRVERCPGAAEAVESFRRLRPRIIVADIATARQAGVDLIAYARHVDPEVVMVLLSSSRDLELAVEAMKDGASDYLIKPIDDHQLLRSMALVDPDAAPDRNATGSLTTLRPGATFASDGTARDWVALAAGWDDRC